MSIQCPKCNSIQISAQKKGFGLLKAIAGIFVAGPIGVVAGAIGKDNVLITCLNCGNKWKPNFNIISKEKNTSNIKNELEEIKEKKIKEKSSLEINKEVYDRTGLSASHPKLTKLGKSKKRK